MGAEQQVARRVVFDTGVIISAFALRSRSIIWIREHLKTECTPLLSADTMAELWRVLHYPKLKVTPAERLRVISAYLPFCEAITVADPCPVLCRDPKDQAMLDLAFCGHADVLVTGDRDLLSAAGTTGFAIETPAQYAARVGRR